MASWLFWTLQDQFPVLFWQIRDAMLTYDKFLPKTFNELGRDRVDVDPILIVQDRTPQTIAFIDRACDIVKGIHGSHFQYDSTQTASRDLANDIAVWLCNSTTFRSFTLAYWRHVVDVGMGEADIMDAMERNIPPHARMFHRAIRKTIGLRLDRKQKLLHLAEDYLATKKTVEKKHIHWDWLSNDLTFKELLDHMEQCIPGPGETSSQEEANKVSDRIQHPRRDDSPEHKILQLVAEIIDNQ